MTNDNPLNNPIPARQVRYRQQGGGNVMYVPGEYVFQAMNEVFGNTGWSTATQEVSLLSADKELTKFAKGRQAKQGDKFVATDDDYQWRVNYYAQVAVSLSGDVEYASHSDIGFGQGIDKDLGKAHESAMKEAVTDAVKRACRYFGPRVGLYLYFSEGRTEALVGMIMSAPTLDEALEVCQALVPEESRCRTDADKKLRAAALAAFTAKKKELGDGK